MHDVIRHYKFAECIELISERLCRPLAGSSMNLRARDAET